MNQIVSPAPRIAVRLGVIVASVSALVLIGWLVDSPRLRHFTTVWSAMAPLSALLLIGLGLAICWLRRRSLASTAALSLTGALAVAVLVEYLVGVQVGLAALSELFRAGQAPTPELPAPDTAAAALALITALLLFRLPTKFAHDLADVLASVVGIICLEVLIEYGYSIAHFASFRGFRQVAPHTTASMMVLAFAVVACRPSFGLFAAMTGKAQSAALLRWLLPITLTLCLMAGWLHVLALRESIGATVPENVGWTITGIVVVLAVLLFITSAEMRKTEAIVQRRQEDLLAATAAAEAASEAKSRFIAVMSHELRTPLTAIIGYADLLDLGIAGEVSKATRSYLERIRQSSWHLTGMIDAVLFYASGRLPAEQNITAGVDVSAVARDVLESFAKHTREKKLEVELIAPPRPVIVTTDAGKLRQILLNLIGNAVKFTEKGGIVVSINPSDDRVSIQVSDTGPGIEPDFISRIFEPFQLVDDTHTRVAGGMGLGLALAHRLADQIGATISVSSVMGKGTSFTVELLQPIEKVALDDTRILVVDDEVPVLRIMARALARHAHDVQQAMSGAEALDRLKTNGAVDVIVTDISMPGMSGIDLVGRLRANGDRTPVLFVTGAELNESELADIDRLGGQLLRKPFDMSELSKAVNDLARSP